MDVLQQAADPALGAPSTQPEGAQIRSILKMTPESSTEEVLSHIQLLQLDNGHMAQVWETLTELLYLGIDTPPSEVLTTIALYIREAQFLKEQEQRHLFIIQKLQNDKSEILKRFHINKPKKVTMTKIREKARFPNKTIPDLDDLGIIDDEQESIADSYDEQLKVKMQTADKAINGELWKSLDDISYVRQNGGSPLKGRDTSTPASSISDMHNTPPKAQIQGFIMAKATSKTSKPPVDIRNNITHGTRESETQVRVAIKAPQSDITTSPSQPTGYLNTTKPKSVQSNYHNKMNKLRNTKKGYVICSEIHVAERGGCYDIPDLGLTISIPSGALPVGSKSEKLVVGLSWSDTGSDIKPVGPILTIKPSGLPFRKPLAISLQHETTIAKAEDGVKSPKVQNTNLVLMQQVRVKTAESWQPVAPDASDPYFTPLGFTASDKMVIFLKNAGQYALIPSQNSTIYIPVSLRVLVFACYVATDGEGVMRLDLYCLENSKASQKLSELMVDSLKQEVPPQHYITSHQVALSGSPHISAQLDDVMDGWTIDGPRAQRFQLGSQCQGHKPAMTFTLKHMLCYSHLRCLLAKLTVTEYKSHSLGRGSSHRLEDSVSLCIDLDQMESTITESLSHSLLTSSFASGLSTKSSGMPHPVFTPQKGGTFIADYFEDKTGNKYTKEPQTSTNTIPSSSSVLRVKVTAMRNEYSWIPDWVKPDLITEIKSEMSSVEKWDKLLAGLNMEFLDEILHQSVDPVLDLISYCEVTGINVSKVKDILGTTGFEDSANILTKYLTRTQKTT